MTEPTPSEPTHAPSATPPYLLVLLAALVTTAVVTSLVHDMAALTMFYGLATILCTGIMALMKGVQATHVAVNSRMTELLELTRTSSKAEGVAEEKKANEA